MADLSRYYAVLGLATGASLQEVKMAYRCMVKAWHPDLFPHDPLRQNKGQRRMKEINAAYNQLKAVAPDVPRRRPQEDGWDNLYGIGIGNIDKQHQMFFKMFEQFNKDYASPSILTIDDEAKMKIYLYILNLRKYALNHFSIEEEYMVKYSYPNYYEHRKYHDDFIKEIFDLENEFYHSNNLAPGYINDFAQSWLKDHITGIDKDFGRYLNEVKGI